MDVTQEAEMLRKVPLFSGLSASELKLLAFTSEVVVAVLGPTAVPGEIGVLTDAPRTATVRAKTQVKALRISPEVFLRLASGRPERALHVMRQLSVHIANDLRALASLNEELQRLQAAAGQRMPH